MPATTRTLRSAARGLALSLVAASAAVAQDGPEVGPATAPEPAVPASIFAGQTYDAEQSRLVAMLEGSWRTSEAIGQGEDADRLRLNIVPMESDLLGRVLYVESARESTPWSPVRQAFFRVYRFGDQLRLRTYEFRNAERADVLANLWLAPDAFPIGVVEPSELLATMDIELNPAQAGFDGRTPYAYPTREYDAVEMTTALSIRNDRIISEDTFFGIDGSPKADLPGAGRLTWTRAQPQGEVQRDEDGLITITVNAGEEGAEAAGEGDVIFLDYEGWLTNGTLFDSSYQRGVALRYLYPGRAIPGFTRGTQPTFPDVRRKIIIPPALGYGDRPVGPIPAGSTIIYSIHAKQIEYGDDEPAGETGDAGNAGGEGGGGGG
ncbi:MAG: CpcT/CpeT family chromophore lyase [Planctomycetota bacterium]